MQLGDLERLESLGREAEALIMAGRTAMAFHDPKQLNREQDRFRARAGLMMSVAEAFLKARELALKVEAQRGD